MIVAVAVALLHFLWQGLLLGLLFLALRPLLRRCEASTRYIIQFAMLLSAPALVVSTIGWSLTGSASGSALVAPAWIPRWALAVLAVWACGASSLALRTGLAFVHLRRLRATGLPLRALSERVRALGKRLGLRGHVAVVESPAVASPMVTGVLRPMILLPLGLATRLPPSWIDAIVAHELAHVRRHDVVLGMMQRAIEVVLFFHPVVWWISAEIRHCREQACDDLVVDALRSPIDYARALTEVASLSPSTPALAMGIREGSLMSRIRHITQRSPKPVSRPLTRPALGAGLALGIALAVGCLAHIDRPETDGDPEAAALETTPLAPASSSDLEAKAEDSLSIAWLPESVTDFEPEIVAAARRHGVDPNLVAIVVLVESGGNPLARSPMGARGLMQVMPATAEQIATTRGLAEHHEDALDDPEYNLDLGTWFLARQLETFGTGLDQDGAVARAAAAYNGGPDRLHATLRGDAELSEETQRYRELVARLWSERDAPTAPN